MLSMKESMTFFEKMNKNIEINCMFKRREHIFKLIKNLVCDYKCEIYGGAARDYITYDYWKNKFEKEYKLDYTLEEYYDSTCHPESYNGRTLLPTDLDIFISSISDYKHLMEYFTKFYKVNILCDDIEPYFMNLDEKIIELLICKKIALSYINMPDVDNFCKTLFDVIFGSQIPDQMKIQIDNIWKLQIDIIILDDVKISKNIDKYFKFVPINPPFNNPDFICNQVSLIKDPDTYDNFIIISNVDVIPKLEPISSTSLLEIRKYNLTCVQRDYDNLQLIIDEIIQKKATPVHSNKLIGAHRIYKMESKGFIIDYDKIYSSLIVPQDEKCCICYENFEQNKYGIKPCNCNMIVHIDCWSEYHIQKDLFKYCKSKITCPACRSINDSCKKYDIFNGCELLETFKKLQRYRFTNCVGERVCLLKCTRSH